LARTAKRPRLINPQRFRASSLWQLAAGGSSTPESVAAVEKGLPISAIAELRHVLREEEVDRLVIPRRTLAHRRLRREPLSIEESDRALRLARVTTLAVATLGDEHKAMAWLRHEHRLLGGRKPLDLSRTEAGVRLIENVLARIAWGAAL
jgi:putative toxin-antitoxin system antitoxin component (TIGR02293 family)